MSEHGETVIALGTDDDWRGQLSSERTCMFLGAIDGIKIVTDDDIVIFVVSCYEVYGSPKCSEICFVSLDILLGIAQGICQCTAHS